MKRLPLTISTFSKLINNNCVYVDKTKYIYDLFKEDGNYYFLSRPRRFGKSLLVSTLKEFFLGNKELFKDLWIDTSDYQWKKYSVIHLDFSVIEHSTPQIFEKTMLWYLTDIAKEQSVDLSDAPTIGSKLITLVKRLAEKNKIVLLIDEYDKPILDHINTIEIAEKNREILKGFYDVVKGLDAYFHAIFITGVTKVSKTSIFSGMNNLNDISLLPKASALLGYTQEELAHYFLPFIEEFSQQKNIPLSAVMEEMKTWYNGYRFSKSEITVYNPFSILYYLDRKERENYWFRSGTPTFLIQLLKNNPNYLEDLEDKKLTDDYLLDFFDIKKIPVITLLYQTGYLTIEQYDSELKEYQLEYPNQEVKESMAFISVSILTYLDEDQSRTIIAYLKRALKDNNIDEFCKNFQQLISGIPYNLHIEQEKYYHSLFHMLIYALGFDIQSEVLTSKGRIDLVIITKDRVFIFEFKLEKSGEKALEQILEKQYYEKYLYLHKEINLIGLSFNYEDKKLTLDWVTQPYKDAK